MEHMENQQNEKLSLAPFLSISLLALIHGYNHMMIIRIGKMPGIYMKNAVHKYIFNGCVRMFEMARPCVFLNFQSHGCVCVRVWKLCTAKGKKYVFGFCQDICENLPWSTCEREKVSPKAAQEQRNGARRTARTNGNGTDRE